MTAESPRLLGQTVLVVGVDSTIGLAVAQRSKVAGARLIVVGRRSEQIEEIAEDVGVDAVVVADPLAADEVEALLAGLPTRVDHIAVICVSACVEYHRVLTKIARYAAIDMSGGSVLVIARNARGDSRSATRVSLPRLAEIARPARINLIVVAGETVSSAQAAATLGVCLMADSTATRTRHEISDDEAVAADAN